MTTTADRSATRPRRAALPAARRPGLARLTAVELRKTVDTRAGRWLLVAVAGLGAAALGYRVWRAAETPVAFDHFHGTAVQAVMMLLPVLGVLAMTTEWTQRTSLTTFTLVPHRERVLAAKLAAAVLLSTAVTLLVALAAAAAVPLAAALTGDAAAWGDVPRLVAGATVAVVLQVLMGAAFGALLQHTALALIAFFLAPSLWASGSSVLLGSISHWFDIYAAGSALSRFDLGDQPAQVLTAVTAWVVAPLLLGLARSMRREVS